MKSNRNANVYDLMQWCETVLGKQISKATMYRYVIRLRFRFYKAKKKPFVSSINKRRRLAWARAHKSWTAAKWNKVLWSDESYFRVVLGSTGPRVLRTREEANNPECFRRCVQKPGSICVWGCFASKGVGPLHVVNGTVTGEAYVNILQQHLPTARRTLFHNKGYVFQQDNARPHTARVTSAWIRRQRLRVLPWPASSPDLNPIENLWRYLKRRVNRRRPRTQNDLRMYVLEEWARIPSEELQKHIQSMPRRIAEVIKRRGDATKW